MCDTKSALKHDYQIFISKGIAKNWHDRKDLCDEGYIWFLENFPEGGLWDKIVEILFLENKVGWYNWLFKQKDKLMDEISEPKKDKVSFVAGETIQAGAWVTLNKDGLLVNGKF